MKLCNVFPACPTPSPLLSAELFVSKRIYFLNEILDYKTGCEKRLGIEETYRGIRKEYFVFKNAKNRQNWEYELLCPPHLGMA